MQAGPYTVAPWPPPLSLLLHSNCIPIISKAPTRPPLYIYLQQAAPWSGQVVRAARATACCVRVPAKPLVDPARQGWTRCRPSLVRLPWRQRLERLAAGCQIGARGQSDPWGYFRPGVRCMVGCPGADYAPAEQGGLILKGDSNFSRC